MPRRQAGLSNGLGCRILFAFVSDSTWTVSLRPESTMESNVGIEWVVDAVGCVPSALRDVRAVQDVVSRAIDELGLRVLGTPAWHVFEGQGGVTGLVMLTESHLAVHTYPEVGVATFNLYCCSTRPEWPWADRLAESLGAEAVEVRTFVRGALCETFGAEPIAR